MCQYLLVILFYFFLIFFLLFEIASFYSNYCVLVGNQEADLALKFAVRGIKQ